MDYLIVPPLVNKDKPDEGLLQGVWDVAQRKVEGAKEIVFIGYSFPKSDKNIRFRFKDWLSKNTVLASVTVVDPYADNADFKARFNDVLLDVAVPKCSPIYDARTFRCWFKDRGAQILQEPSGPR